MANNPSNMRLWLKDIWIIILLLSTRALFQCGGDVNHSGRHGAHGVRLLLDLDIRQRFFTVGCSHIIPYQSIN